MEVWDKLFTDPFGGKSYITTDGKYYVGTQWNCTKIPIPEKLDEQGRATFETWKQLFCKT